MQVIREGSRLQLLSELGFTHLPRLRALQNVRCLPPRDHHSSIRVQEHDVTWCDGCPTHDDRFVDGSYFGFGCSSHTDPAGPDGQAKGLQLFAIAYRRIDEEGR